MTHPHDASRVTDARLTFDRGALELTVEVVRPFGGRIVDRAPGPPAVDYPLDLRVALIRWAAGGMTGLDVLTALSLTAPEEVRP